MTVFEVLNLRSEYEDLTLNLRVPGDKKPGTLSNMQWFIKNAEQRNKRKGDFPRALEIAKCVVEHEKNRKKKK